MDSAKIMRAPKGTLNDVLASDDFQRAEIVIVGDQVVKNRDGPIGWREYFSPEQVEQFWPGEDWAEINRQAEKLLGEIRPLAKRGALDRLEKYVKESGASHRLNEGSLKADLRLVLSLARAKIEEVPDA